MFPAVARDCPCIIILSVAKCPDKVSEVGTWLQLRQKLLEYRSGDEEATPGVILADNSAMQNNELRSKVLLA